MVQMMNQKLNELIEAKEQLLYLLSLLEKSQAQVEQKPTEIKKFVASKASDKKFIKNEVMSVGYENGLHLLVDKNKLKDVMSRKNKIATAKVTDSFKQLAPSIVKDFKDVISEQGNSLIKKVASLNPSKVLTPAKENTMGILFNYFDNIEIKLSNILHEELKSVFVQGRQHQTLFTGKKDFRKYLEKDIQADLYFEEYMKNVLSIFKNAINSSQLLLDIENFYQKAQDKPFLLKSIAKYCEKTENSMQKFINIVNWLTYTQGNLYQLEKDGVEYVQWSTSHCLQDCVDCRKIENGEEILSNGFSSLKLFNFSDIKGYDLREIKDSMGFGGMELFSHADCRCQFIEIKN